MEQLQIKIYELPRLWRFSRRNVYWLLKRPSANTNFYCHNLKRLKLITSLRLGLSHLYFYKFKHNFQDTLNPI